MTDYKIKKDEFYITRDLANIEVGDTIEIIADKTDSDIVREMLQDGDRVVCGASNGSHLAALQYIAAGFYRLIIRYYDGKFYTLNGETFKYVVPVDTSKFTQYVPEMKE